MSCIRLKRSITELFAIAIVFLNLGTTTASAADLVVVDGELIGATGVTVGTLGLYDVKFVDGSFNSLVSQNLLSIEFTIQDNAQAASQALLDEVFILDPVTNLNFDTNPDLTRGVSDETNGLVATPFLLSPPEVAQVASALSVNIIEVDFDHVALESSSVTLDFADNGGNSYASAYVWANWTPSPVPEPSTYAMMALGLLGVAVMRRRQNQD